MKSVKQNEIETIKSVIGSVIKNRLSKIILFGSRARGDNRIDSDYDLIVVISEELSMKEKMSLASEIRRILAKFSIPNDLLIKSESEIMRFSGVIGTTLYNATREGILL